MIDNGCTEELCPVHMRVDKNDMDEYGERTIFTYRGEYVVFSYSDVDEGDVNMADVADLFVDALSGTLDPDKLNEAMPLIARHTVYHVGHGALSDAQPETPIFKFTGAHDNMVDDHTDLVLREKF